MERPKKRKTINKCWKEKEVATKNSGTHKKKLQQKKRLKLSEKEIIEQRATERERKRKWSENQQITWSGQKIQGARLKNKNRKALQRSKINSKDSQKDYSTTTVQKHRALKAKIDFTKTSKLISRKEKSLKKKQ